MKTACKILLLLSCVATQLALAQIPHSTNVIVVVQENRTPDNLFAASDLRTRGAEIIATNGSGSCLGMNVPLMAVPLATCYDIDHSHRPAFEKTYDGGSMDGACQVAVTGGGPNCPIRACPSPMQTFTCSEYQYVDNSDLSIQPYFDIADQYGFADHFFQTNQGPSFPAHQFLLSGSSAPNEDTPHYTNFAAENSQDGTRTPAHDAGCAADINKATVQLIDPSGNESSTVFPCFEHRTLTDLLDDNGWGWLYYGDEKNSYWTAPNAIRHICNNDANRDGCGTGNGSNQNWNNDVKPFLETKSPPGTLAPFMRDLYNCSFPSSWAGGVMWVIPDGRWSDHAGLAKYTKNIGLGPDWVANIVNLLGGAVSG